MKKNLNITNPRYSEHIRVCDIHFGPALHGKFTQFQSYTVCNNNGCQAALNANGPTICHSHLLTHCGKVGQVPASNPNWGP